MGHPSRGWLMTSVAPWGETHEDAFDQGLVELGLGDSRLVEVRGAMLPMGFEPVMPEPLPMGSIVEAHLAVGYAFDGSTACAGAAWATAVTPEGDACAIVATLATQETYEDTEMRLRRAIQQRLASRDLEVTAFDSAVDEVTAAQGHHGVAVAALILPESMSLQQGRGGRIRGLTKEARPTPAKVVDKAPAAPAKRPGAPTNQGIDFSF